MAKKKNKAEKKQNSPASRPKKEEERVTMKALEEMSDSDDNAAPPESQWSTKAKNLRKEIEDGKFDRVLGALKKAKQDANREEEEFEEDSLGSSEDEDDDVAEEEDDTDAKNDIVDNEPSEDEVEEEEEGEDEEEERDVEEESKDANWPSTEKASERDPSDNDSSEEEDSDDEEEDSPMQRMKKNNHFNSKALSVVTAELASSHAHLPWAETFHVVPATPLPFGRDGDKDSSPMDIHDDLKREVAFYNSALEAVHEARIRCKEAHIPFSRPDDFFAEMIKTDDHMAKVKDRLIFETKKIEAVAQRKSNKEQKLRSKESQANKVAEKAKRKRDHFEEVEEWAQSAAKNRGGALRDDADEMYLRGKGQNKKREHADRKFGFGGKTGRFKQNDRASKNDVSGFNPRGNFAGMGSKKTAKNSGGAGAARPGKRARDSKRARR